MPSEAYAWANFDTDESVVWSGHPRITSIISSVVILAIIVIGLAIYNPLWGAIGVVLGIFGVGFGYLALKNTQYVLTNKRLYRKAGVFGENSESASLEKIQNKTLSKGVFGSIFGYGSVSISTAAGAGDLDINNIDDPTEVKQLLDEQHSKVLGNITATTGRSTGQESVSVMEVADELERFRKNLQTLNQTTGARK